MSKATNKIGVLALVLLISGILIAAPVRAQSTASVSFITSLGGATDITGTQTYNDGQTVTVTATAGTGFVFLYFVVVDSTHVQSGTYTDNPLSITVSGGASYGIQAIFQPETVEPSINTTGVLDFSTDAIVIVQAGVGGTTTPAAGTYALADASSLTLTATPMSGFTFSHWVIGGYPLSHGAYSFTDTPTNNPYTVSHGYGNTYTYQPVFTPTTVPEFSAASTVILTIILIAVALGAGAVTYSSKRKSITQISGIHV